MRGIYLSIYLSRTAFLEVGKWPCVLGVIVFLKICTIAAVRYGLSCREIVYCWTTLQPRWAAVLFRPRWAAVELAHLQTFLLLFKGEAHITYTLALLTREAVTQRVPLHRTCMRG